MTPAQRAAQFTNDATRLLGAPSDYQELSIETLERAGQLLEDAYRLQPDRWYTLDNFGMIRDELSLARGGPFVSLDLYEQSLAMRVSGTALLNKARILGLQEGRHEEAIRLYKRALIQQGEGRAAYALAPCMLMQACRTDDPDTWSEAWYWFEWRKGADAVRDNPIRWRGEPLAGKRLVIYLDFGIGDRIWAMRWVKMAKEQGATTIVITEADTVRLCREQAYVDEVHTAGDGEGIETDYVTFATSMPGYMDQTSRQRTVAPYLRVPFVPIVFPKQRVGLCWWGSTDRGYQSWRNVRFDALWQTLPHDETLEYVSLQKGHAEIHAKASVDGLDSASIHDCRDVYDTAQLIQSCDLVITIGSMISMLAPALGVRTWVLNTFGSAWQFGPSSGWNLDGGDYCPHWFPQQYMTIFRQGPERTWERPLQLVADFLRRWRPM